MVQVFATRTWGAHIERWPLITFGKKGYRDSLLNRAQQGDLICLVATNNTNTAAADRGRLLAVCEFGRDPIDAESVLWELNKREPLRRSHYNSDGTFKWPFALPILRAWRFTPAEKIQDVLGRQLKQSATPGAELLSAREASKILALPKDQIDINSSLIKALKKKNEEPHDIKNSRAAPTPSVGGYYITREKRPASVYVFRFETSDIFKIGWAFDVAQRLGDINKHIPDEYLQMKWTLFAAQRFKDQFSAYGVEQEFLRALSRFRTSGERIKIDAKAFRKHWHRYLSNFTQVDKFADA